MFSPPSILGGSLCLCKGHPPHIMNYLIVLAYKGLFTKSFFLNPYSLCLAWQLLE